jgi:filamentous hemagglutinin family protein
VGAVAAVAFLLAGGHARAGNVLRTVTAPPGVLPPPSATLSPRPATDAGGLRQALDAIRAAQNAQAAARTAAALLPPSVADGLRAGSAQSGLAPGLVVDGSSTPVGIGAPQQGTDADGHVTVTLVQRDARAFVPWSSFNVGSNTVVYFDQRQGGADRGSWAVLNRVSDPSGAPSRILGSIRAEGQVYLLNRNGVLFGGTSQVDVGTLVVSGLDIAKSTVDAQIGRFLTETDTDHLYNLSFASNGAGGNVVVEPGAILQADQGRVVLLGHEVRNGGWLRADDGQVYLAAGDTIQLAQSANLSDVRGLAVPDRNFAPVDASGTVVNGGLVSADRGNVTMVGGHTRQDGLVTATTGAEANGSIFLGADGLVTALGPGSVTQILPDQGGKKVLGAGAAFRGSGAPSRSTVVVRGIRIDLEDEDATRAGARLYAPAGSIAISSVSNLLAEGPDLSSVYVGKGATIDVSGLAEVPAAMAQNVVQAELRGDELRDNPLLRTGRLRGQTVYFDARQGAALTNGTGVADLSGYLDLIERDPAQLMTSGGRVELDANQLVLRQGSLVDLSGGSLRWAGGYVRTSVLVDAQGNRVPIERAIPGVQYVALDGNVIVGHSRWGVTETYATPLARTTGQYEPGYVEGGSAGSLTIATLKPYWWENIPAPVGQDVKPPNPSATGAFRILDGDVRATIVAGPYQRSPNTGSTDPTVDWQERPLAASLTLSNAGDVAFTAGTPVLAAGYAAGDALDPALRYQHALPLRWFDGTTFGKLTIASGVDSGENPSVPGNRAPGGHLVLSAPSVVDLGDYGAFKYTGTTAEIAGTIRAPGGTIELSVNQLGDLAGSPAPTLHLASTAVLDAAGRLTNDHRDGIGAPMRPLDGGSVTLASARTFLDQGSLVDVSGGAQLDPSGTKITRGKAGTITVDVSRYPTPAGDLSLVTTPYLGELALDGTLEGHALGKGGTLRIRTGADVVIGGTTFDPGQGLFDPGFFRRGGFSTYDLVGGTSVTVLPGTVIASVPESLASPDFSQELPTGTLVRNVTRTVTLDASLRPPMTIALGARAENGPATLRIGTGAAIRLDPGSTIALSSSGTIAVDGTLEADGGSISLAASGTSSVGSQIQLGTQSRLVARGWQKTVLVSNEPVSSLEEGGHITLSASTVTMAPSTVLDVSGASGYADLPPGSGGRSVFPGVSVPIGGDAGTLEITAGSGSILGGVLRLSSGAPGAGSGAGGSLVVRSPAATVVVTQHQAGQSAGGQLWIAADSVNASGADAVTLIAADPASPGFDGNNSAVLFDGPVTLTAHRSIQLGAPVLGALAGTGGDVLVRAPYVSLDGLKASVALDTGVAPSTGSLTVKGEIIDVTRTVVNGCVQGQCAQAPFARVTLDAARDIRLADHDRDGNAADSGGLLSPTALELRAAQVYVESRLAGAANLARADDDPGFLVYSADRIDVVRNAGPAPVPFSFGERLTLRAPVIVQGGVVRAPAGEIRLEGRDPTGTVTPSVTLLPGSLTSTSLEGLTVPFGATLAGGQFLGYGIPDGVTRYAAAPTPTPSRSITIDAPSVALRPGSVVDVSGGGDVMGYQFYPGTGGSADVMAARALDASGNPLSAYGISLGKALPAPYAILPGNGTRAVPIARSSDLRDGRLQVGDQVWIQGVPGVRDGYYTLYPAHYALLPGGLLVQPLPSSYATAPATYQRADGAYVAPGRTSHLVYDSDGAPSRVVDGRYGQFVVMPQAVFLQYGNVVEYSMSDAALAFGADAGVSVRTLLDAGSLELRATALTLKGIGRFAGGTGADGRSGLLGNLDLAAPAIAIVANGATAPDSTFLTIDAAALQAFGAGSVLIGGTRSSSADPTRPGTVVSTDASQSGAREVLVDLNGGTWSGPEILLAARERVTVADGTTLRAAGTGSVDAGPLLLGGDGALLRVSVGGRAAVVRTGIPASPGAVLSVGSVPGGPTLDAASGSVTLEASGHVELGAGTTLSAAQLDLASADVHLGAASPGAGATGTWLSPELTARLAGTSDLLIRAHDAIHVHGSVALGSRAGATPSMPSLVLDTPVLQGEGGGADEITAGALTLQNSGAAGAPGPAGAATLTLDVDRLRIGPGQVAVSGFSEISGRAGLVEAGGGLDAGSASVRLATAQVSVVSGASGSIRTTGALELGSDPSSSAPGPATLGGALTLQGGSVSLDTRVIIPGGTADIQATSTGIMLGSRAVVQVNGSDVDFHETSKAIPSGRIALTAAGDVSVDPAAVLDVSAAPGGDAGELSVSSGGTATLRGTLRGGADAGRRGGSFSLRAHDVQDLAGLNGLLEAGGFTHARSLDLDQDVALGAGERMTARTVELRSRAGGIRIDGTVDAAAKDAADPDGGVIRLRAAGDVVLGATGTLDASAFAGALPSDAFPASSGQVELVSDGGRVDTAPGSLVTAAGGAAGGGLLVVRAPRQGTDVATTLGGDVSGVRAIVVQGSAAYAAATVDSALATQVIDEGASWLQTATAGARLASANPALAGELQIGAAVEIASAADLTIASPVLVAGRLGPGHLGFTASRDLLVTASVSDGFADVAGGDPRDAALGSGPSAGLSLEAGGSITLGAAGAPVLVRTGTGSVTACAGVDIAFADPASALYTAGARTARAAGFAATTAGEFPTGGGDVTLVAGRDIVAPVTAQTTSAWLYRSGASTWNGTGFTVNQQTSWSIVYGSFEQAVGALGGGDVTVEAGRDVRELAVAIPTTGQLVTTPGQVARPGDLVVRGGGDLELAAGRDVVGGLFVLGQGRATLRAGGDVTRSDRPEDARMLRTGTTSFASKTPRQLAPLLGLADAVATVSAAGDVAIQGAFDPMRQPAVGQNLTGGAGTAFSGYTGRTALEALSAGGSTTYDGDPYASLDVSLSGKPAYQVPLANPGLRDSLLDFFSYAPPTLRLTSAGGSLRRSDRFAGAGLRLASAPRGTLELLALDDVQLPASVVLDDLASIYARGPLAPLTTTGTNGALVTDAYDPVNPRGDAPIHAGDPEPVTIVALNGSICAQAGGSCLRAQAPQNLGSLVGISSPKPVQAYAGKDLLAGYWVIQHSGREDVSVLSAGRDVYEPVVEVTGEGSVLVEAGRDVTFGEKSVTGGKLDAPPREGGALFGLGDANSAGSFAPVSRVRGADLYILAGAAPGRVDWAGFEAAYVDGRPAGGAPVVRTYLPELRAYLRALDPARFGALTDSELVAAFDALPAATRRPFLEQVLFAELRETGIDYNTPSSPRYHSYDRGFEALERLFPVDSGSLAARDRGNVILHGKPVETELDGSITILAPYGKVEVGTDVVQAKVDPSKGGVVTRRGGDIRIMADENIDLFTSRVFTLQGGDITMWSSNGSITAGSGSKTSVFQKPLQYRMLPSGEVQVDVFGLATGAGIGVLDALEGDAASRPPSRLDLIAPHGEVNAGDAGIRVVGDINIAAAVVVGVENIQVSGATAGVPKVEAPSLGALTTASAVSQSAAASGVGPEAQPKTTAAELPSIITVEVVGYETPEPGAEQDPKKRTGGGRGP